MPASISRPARRCASGIPLLKAIATLHRLDIVHRDIKTDNIHLGQDGVLRILDLGVAISLGERKPDDLIGQAGTPSYMAPELFDNPEPQFGYDLYAAGVTLYHLLTRKYPYGEIEPFQTPKFGEPARPTRWRPEIPGWLENILLKAVAREAKDRFETAEEFLLALERGAARPIAAPGPPAAGPAQPAADVEDRCRGVDCPEFCAAAGALAVKFAA
jgi:serine/threonine protein kinase